MYRFRSFQNSDPPAIAEIWRSQPPQRGLVHMVSSSLLEQHVFGKPYFDRHALLIATDGDRRVGFAHGGFGPSDDGAAISTELAVTSMVMVHAAESPSTLAADLLAQSESYLKQRGAKVLYGGGIRPLNPYYLGLYGGSELPGILESDTERQTLFRSQGYREIDRVVIFHCDLRQFRAPVSRQLLQLRRRMRVEVVADPPSATWWEACTTGVLDRLFFQVVPNEGGPPQGRISVWNVEPLATHWGVRAAGLIDLQVDESQRRQGMASLLISETLRQIHLQGITLVEVQAMAHNLPALALYKKLGFAEIDHGSVFRKE